MKWKAVCIYTPVVCVRCVSISLLYWPDCLSTDIILHKLLLKYCLSGICALLKRRGQSCMWKMWSCIGGVGSDAVVSSSVSVRMRTCVYIYVYICIYIWFKHSVYLQILSICSCPSSGSVRSVALLSLQAIFQAIEVLLLTLQCHGIHIHCGLIAHVIFHSAIDPWINS